MKEYKSDDLLAVSLCAMFIYHQLKHNKNELD